MLMILMGIYTLYTLISIYVSVMQIGYVNVAKNKDNVLLKPSDFIKAGRYSVAKEKFNLVQTFFSYIVFVVFMGGGIAYLDQNIMFDSPLLSNVAVVLTFVIINSILGLPFSYYEKFVLDEEFGFNKSSKKLFIKDTITSFIISLVLGSLVIGVVYYIISSTSLWWLWSFLFIFGVIILINMLYPTFRAMFFDKLTPLDDEELNDKIQSLMDKTGFVSSGVFISDASKRDGRLNAYFGGLGKSKRVVLFDTLLEKLSAKELLAVLGHELGHFAHGDIYKNIGMMGLMLFFAFAFFGNIDSSLYMELGISESPASIMIIFMLFMSVVGFFMMPIMGVVSRHNEYEADKMGSELESSEALGSALMKLVEENKSFPLSHPLYIFFNYTHPPVIERLKELGVYVPGLKDNKSES